MNRSLLSLGLTIVLACSATACDKLKPAAPTLPLPQTDVPKLPPVPAPAPTPKQPEPGASAVR